MIEFKTLLIVLLALSLAQAQTTCNSNASSLTRIATGTILLNPNDIDTSSANKNYYQDISAAAFDKVDKLGYAFAIAGFEGACNQKYYTLSVDVVEFQLENKRMRIVINFRNPNDNTLTRWSRVKLTYLVVSRTFDDTYTNIWAFSV
jgi:hypothetical protein